MASYYQSLRHQLNAQLQNLTSNIHASLQAPPDSPSCSCNQPGCCRIALTKITNDDGTTYLKPILQNCSCPQAWKNFHARQLNLVNAHLTDLKIQTVQLKAFEEGVQSLLLRHRELAKQQLKKEQYWLCQDYALTDRARWLYNLDVRSRKQRRRFGMAVSRREGELSTENDDDGTNTVGEEELPVEVEELDIDDDVYEFLREQPNTGMLLLGPATATSSDSPSTTEGVSTPCSTTVKTTLNGVRRGQYLTIDQVLDRFEDLKQRAHILLQEWETEDHTLARQINAVIPCIDQDACACTAEHKLYHLYKNFGNPQTFANLEAETSKSDLLIEIRQQTTADQGLEIQSVLRLIREHLAGQIADVEAAAGREGMRKGLVRYLSRYDSDMDLRVQVENGGYPSEAFTLDLSGRIEEMLARWARRDMLGCATIGNGFLE
ncbi:MAG: hypothetical protein Q9168_002121 [Polycauliona sp. 1 TL-2023]